MTQSVATVLIVDDEERLRELLRGYLAQAGFTVLLAADGPAALELARAHQPDLVVLDLMLEQEPLADGRVLINFNLAYNPRTDRHCLRRRDVVLGLGQEQVAGGGRADDETIATPCGIIQLEHSYPTDASSALLFGAMDAQRAAQADLWSLPIVGFAFWRDVQARVYDASQLAEWSELWQAAALP